MDVFLCGRTALDVYFLGGERLGSSFYSRLERVEVRSLDGCAHTARHVAGCELGFLERLHAGRLDVLVPSRQQSYRSEVVRQHVWSGDLPKGAFVRCAPGVYLSSPEFLALTLAGKLGRYATLQLCMQLCGTYANSLTAPHGMVQHPRLSSRERMRAMAEFGANHDGRRSFAWAAHHVIDGAASHTESGTALMHAMPWQVGGFALRVFTLNKRINYDEKNRLSTGADFCFVDLLDEDVKFGWEYQGEEGHSDVAGAVPYDKVNRAQAAGLWGNKRQAGAAGSAGSTGSVISWQNDRVGSQIGGSNLKYGGPAPQGSGPKPQGGWSPPPTGSLSPQGGVLSSQGDMTVLQNDVPNIFMSYGANQLENDTRKLAALADMGYDVRPLVWGQIATVREFDRVARVTAEKLGVDASTHHAFSNDPEMMCRRVELHRGLLLRRFYWEKLL